MPQICSARNPKNAIGQSGAARRKLDETLQVLRVVVLNGPRQAGKTMLARAQLQHVAVYWGVEEP